jgi:RNA polymerase sigma-70 factor (ECF subfamily)
MNRQVDHRYELYQELAARHGATIARVAAAHEADAVLRQDLEQEIHLQIWRSLDLYRGQAALATWTFRIAHNVCSDHIARQVRSRRLSGLVSIEELEVPDGGDGPEAATRKALALERLYAVVHRLKPLDRQLMVLYLEDLSAAGIAEITGLSAGAVATRIHRLKTVLADAFAPGANP